MKKLIALSAAVFISGASIISAQAACTAQDAVSKLTTVSSAMSANKIPTDKVADASQQLNQAGALLGKGDYAGACAIYDKLITDYKLLENPVVPNKESVKPTN